MSYTFNPVCIKKSLGKGGGEYIVIHQRYLLISLLELKLPEALQEQSAKHCHTVVGLLVNPLPHVFCKS